MSVLRVENLTKTFGGLTAVDHVNFAIEENQILGLIGPNGAGKTTLFNLVTGVYKTTEGDIHYNGKSIKDLPPHAIANAGITRTFQNIRLFKKLTVYENIYTACHNSATYNLAEALVFGALPRSWVTSTRFAREERKIHEETEQLLEIMDLADRRDFRANNLPYGLQRRLEIARALALKPRLLLLDEPAAGMNPDETERLTALIGSIRDQFKLTVLLIEHHMDLVMGICDNIVVLNFGAKIAEGNATAIQSNPLVKEAYLGEEETPDA